MFYTYVLLINPYFCGHDGKKKGYPVQRLQIDCCFDVDGFDLLYSGIQFKIGN